MQTIGHIIVKHRKILVLVRHKRYSRQFKLRNSGKDGNRFEEEEIHLSANPGCLNALLRGKAIEL